MSGTDPEGADRLAEDGPSDQPETRGATAEGEEDREAALEAMPGGNAEEGDTVVQREPDTADHDA